ncbi:hypothetical protein GOP47_0013872 [Adiantum capillus-veneris]|uniref:Uncharacterized protein n=1 Tax=Adiantum capillus-veneris TaxID=13818 RepID=A0A9D4ZG68_ADICA|nr:hypothetical protein GOP47_0013872 [Adiantum capillus-veneris]
MDPIVTLMRSFKGSFADHYHGPGTLYNHVHDQQFEAFADKKDDEESTRRKNGIRCYYHEDGSFDYFDYFAVVIVRNWICAKRTFLQVGLKMDCALKRLKENQIKYNRRTSNRKTLAQYHCSSELYTQETLGVQCRSGAISTNYGDSL